MAVPIVSDRIIFESALAATGCWCIGLAAELDPRTWQRPAMRINCPDGEPLTAAAASPALTAAYDQLIGEGRWIRRGTVGGTPRPGHTVAVPLG